MREVYAYVNKNGPVLFKKKLKRLGLSERFAQYILSGNYDRKMHSETVWLVRRAIGRNKI